MASEEQKKDLQVKLTVGAIVLVIGLCIYAISTPGLDTIKQKLLAKPNDPQTPTWLYRIGRIYEATWRRPKAEETYRDIYYLYSGDEKSLAGIAASIEDSGWPAATYCLVPKWENPNRQWIGGEGAAPHPIMADVLLQLCKLSEEDRNYQEARFYYLNVLNNFPAGTEAHTKALDAEKRDKSRAF